MSDYLVFFDLDGTILDTSSAKLFIKYLYHNQRINFSELIGGAMLGINHRLGIINTESQVKKWIMKYKDQPEQDTVTEVQEWFESDVKNHIRESLVKEMDRHRSAGGRLIILSAATNYICDVVKTHLEMDDVICTRLGVKNGRFTGRLADSYCYGKEKLLRALSYCQNNGYTLSNACAYGDSLADAYLMTQTGTPVCVNPDWRLDRLAQLKGWRIIDH